MAVSDSGIPNSGFSGGRRDDEVYSITSAPESAKLERQARTRRYLISMAIRTICFLGAVFTTGILRWVLIACAIGLPYIAVVLANSPVRKPGSDELPIYVLKQTQELTDVDSFVKVCDEAREQSD